jgi:hypothetical protein
MYNKNGKLGFLVCKHNIKFIPKLLYIKGATKVSSWIAGGGGGMKSCNT